MNDLEDTHCEVRRTVSLQQSSLPPLPTSSTDDQPSPSCSPGYNSPPHTLGAFLEDTNYSWLSSHSRLTVFNTKTGASISTWTFKNRVTSVCQFPSLPGQIPLLLVGLDNDAQRLRDSQGTICVFDPTMSQVLRAIRLPSGVEQLCIITGGSEWEETDDQRLDILPNSSGLACVALRNLDHIIIDLRRTSWENFHDAPSHDESNPAELDITDPSTNNRHRNRERHAVHNLMSTRIERYLSFNREDFESSVLPLESLTTSLICSRKIGCLISGCLGHVVLWQTDGIVRWISPPLEETILISHIALLEPTDDPRPFIYLWIAYQDDTPVSPLLRMFAMLFERKYPSKGTNNYFHLEGEPSMKLELELDEGSRIINLCPVIKETFQESESGNRNEESLMLISTEGRTFLFDLNQWYKEQMPRTLGDCANIDAILATYHSKTEVPSPDNALVSCTHLPGTLKEFPGAGQGAPEEFFFPNSLSLEWIELGTSRIITWMTRGVQSQLLREMSMAGPVIMIHPAETFHRCVSVGLIPPSGDSYSSDSDHQRDSLLTLCLEQRWTTFLLRCVKEWSDGSAAYLYPSFIRWTVQRASTIKLTAHTACIPLFDQSGSSIGEAEVKTLRSFSQQMECLSNVAENFPDGCDQNQQQRTLKRISVYLQVLLWFYDVGLLPETQEVDEELLPISIIMRIPYPAERLIGIYREKREKYSKEGVKKGEKEEDLFIDELITRDCSELISQWEREATETVSDGRYPPPSLQSLLRSILTDCHHQETNEMENKHQIIIYLLMDLVMLLQGSCPSVDQLIKYPGAFKLSPSLIKLTQAFWLLDHEDYHGFLEIMTGQLVCDSDVKDWHHKLVIRTLIRSTQNKLALIYLRVRKPPLSSLDEQGTVISLSVEYGLVQSAFHRRPPSHYSQLLRRFFKACKDNGRLNDILHLAMDFEEEETFVQYLEEEKCEETRLLYYLQRSKYNEASNIQPIGQNKLGMGAKNSKSCSFAVSKAYNATLPEITRKFTSQLAKKTVQVDPDCNHPRPLSHFKSRSRVREMHEAVMRKAKETFTRGDRLQIPFITAPSLSLKATIHTNEANCVLFAERCRSYGKRTLDQMREESPGSQSGPRKRRRTDEDVSQIDGNRQLSLSMVFDTPLVKRKNQLINSRNTQVETPHSILKIRRMIQDSLTPEYTNQASPSEEEREKRPRQIRFSLNQPKFEDSIVDGSCDGAEQDDEKEEGEIDDEPKSIETSNREESMESEAFHSPDNSGDLGQSTVLSGDSNLSISIAGPRPRPSLRKCAFNDSTNDLLKKSLKRNSMFNRDSSFDSSKLSLDNSLGSDIISSTLINPGTPKVSNPSICGTTVLSGGSSFTFSPAGSPEKIKRNESPVSVDSIPSYKDESLGVQEEEIDHSDESVNSTHIVEEIVTVTTSITTTVLVEDFEDNPEVTDVNDNTEHESNFEDRDKSYHSMEFEEITEERIESTEIIHSLINEAEVSPEANDLQSPPVSPEEENPLDDAEETKNEHAEDSEHSPSDDLDEELLPLKYEDDDDDDEVFESLTNSIDPQNALLRPESETLNVLSLTSPKKTPTARFYEEFNITDDESRSVDESLFTSKKKQNEEIVMESISEEKRAESADITDDESDPEDVKSSEKTRKKSSHESPKTQIEPINEDRHLDLSPIRVTRSQRASSTAPEPSPNTPETPKASRTRRATSLVQDLSPKTLTSSGTESLGSPVKRRLRRATSLVKEVLTSSLSTEKPLGDVSEVPVRRSSRRKDSEASKSPTTPETIEEVPEDVEPVKRTTRGKRGVSVTKDVNVTPRKTRGASIAKEHDGEVSGIPEESVDQKSKPKRTRGSSKDSDETPPPRRTRAASVTQDIAELKITRSKRGRTTSASSEVHEEPEKPFRKTRAASVADIPEDPVPKRLTRAASVSKEPDEVKTRSRRVRTASVTSEVGDDDGDTSVRKTRGTSVTKEIKVKKESKIEEELPKRGRRAASVAKDPDVPKRKRGGSVAKDTEEDTKDSGKRRITRASSVSKDDEDEENESVQEKLSHRSTRRRGSASKELPSESLRTRGGSIVKDVIPEENSDESLNENVRNRNSSRVAEGGNESNVRGGVGSIDVIPEEDEEVGRSGVGRGRGRGRGRRAMSVDLPQGEKRITRRQNSSDNGDEESKGRKVPVRRKRAASETKDVEEGRVERVRRGRKGEEYSFAPPEEARGAADGFSVSDQIPEFIFSPPVSRFKETEFQDRREIVNFIPPLTEEEKKMIPVKSRMSRADDVKQVTRLSHVPGYRTKFVLPKWSKSTPK